MKKIAIALVSLIFIIGCGDTRKHYINNNSERDAMDEKSPAAVFAAKDFPTPEPEPTEAPTPIPRDSKSDIIYANGSKFLVTYGSADLTNGIVIYKSVEVPNGEDQEDILWVVPGGLIVTEKYSHKVRKIQ